MFDQKASLWIWNKVTICKARLFRNHGQKHLFTKPISYFICSKISSQLYHVRNIWGCLSFSVCFTTWIWKPESPHNLTSVHCIQFSFLSLSYMSSHRNILHVQFYLCIVFITLEEWWTLAQKMKDILGVIILVSDAYNKIKQNNRMKWNVISIFWDRWIMDLDSEIKLTKAESSWEIDQYSHLWHK